MYHMKQQLSLSSIQLIWHKLIHVLLMLNLQLIISYQRIHFHYNLEFHIIDHNLMLYQPLLYHFSGLRRSNHRIQLLIKLHNCWSHLLIILSILIFKFQDKHRVNVGSYLRCLMKIPLLELLHQLLKLCYQLFNLKMCYKYSILLV